VASTRYERGRAAEYRCMTELRAEGWEVARTAGSHGKADVISWKASDYSPIASETIRFIQIKTYTTRRIPTYADELNGLRDMVLPARATAELWVRKIGTVGWTHQYIVANSEVRRL